MEEVRHYSHNRLDINHINKENNIIRECKQWYRTDSWFLPDPSCVTPSRTTHAKNVSQCVNERVYWSPQGNSFIAFPPAQEVQRSGSVTHQCPCSWHGFRVSLESIWAGQMLVNMDTVSGSSRENIVCLTPRSGVSKLRDLWPSRRVASEMKLPDSSQIKGYRNCCFIVTLRTVFFPVVKNNMTFSETIASMQRGVTAC